MSNYNCNKCNFHTHNKFSYSRHLETKKHLRLEDIQNATLCNTNATLCNANATLCNTNAKNQKHICKYCDKEFTLRQGVERHIKNYCKKNKDESFKEMARLMNEVENMKKEMLKKDKKDEEFQKIILKKDKKYENLQKQLSKLNNKLQIANNNALNNNILNNNILNNTTLNNTNNTIVVLNSFYKPDMSQLTDESIRRNMKNISMCVPNLVKDVYFNSKNPANHSICVSNLKKEFATVFDGEQWDTITIEYLLDKLSFWGEGFFEEWLEDNGSDKLIERFERRLENMECNTEMQKTAKNNLVLMCYNERKRLKLQNCSETVPT
jgi:hypothetical protein